MFQPRHSKIILFVFLITFLVGNWFFVLAPYSEVNKLLGQSRQLINDNLLSKIPDDLVVTLKSGKISLNRPSPYCLVVDNKTNDGFLFDLNRPLPVNLDDHSLCAPIAVINQTSAIYKDNESGLKITKFPVDTNLTLSKTVATDYVDKYLPTLISVGRVLYFVLPFILAGIVYGFLLLINFWYALVAKFFTRLVNVQTSVTSEEIFDVTLLFYTLFIAVDWIVFGYLLPKVNGSFPFRNTIFITLMTLYYQTLHPKKSTDEKPIT